MPSPSRLIAILSLGLVAVSLAAVFIRLADAPGLVVATYRMVIASAVLLPLSWQALRRASYTPRSVGYALLAGLFLAAHFATWISSLSYTTVAASVSLVASQPLWVALLSWLFLGSAPTFLVLFGVVLAVTGGVIIGFGDFAGGSAPLLGDSLAVIGAVCSAAYFLLGRSAQRQGLSLNAYIALAYATAALALLPLPLIAGQAYWGYSGLSLVWIVLLALVPQLVGHTSFNYVLRYLSPTLVATLMLLEPLGASLLALILFQELPPPSTLVGASILLGGVLLTVKGSRENEEPSKK